MWRNQPIEYLYAVCIAVEWWTMIKRAFKSVKYLLALVRTPHKQCGDNFNTDDCEETWSGGK